MMLSYQKFVVNISRLKPSDLHSSRFKTTSRALMCYDKQILRKRQRFNHQNKKLNFERTFYNKFLRPSLSATKHFSTYVSNVPNVSMSHVKRILHSKKMEHKEGFTCLTTKCVFCQPSPNLEENLFINKVTGHFMCNKCKVSGPWDLLEKTLKKENTSLQLDKPEIASERWTSMCEKCQHLQSLSKDKVQQTLSSFNLKKSYEESIFELEPLVNQDGTHLYFPVKNGELIVGVKELSVDGSETTAPNIGCKGLLMIASSQKRIRRKEAIVVLQVRDLLALGSWKLSSDIICLPHGTMNLPQEILPMLEKYEKVILWFGNGDGLWESARQFSKKLNEERCYFVRPSEEQPAPYQADTENKDVKQIIESALPIAHKCIIHFSNLRDEVLSHLQNTEKAEGVKWSRFPVLNTILKGHRRGEMTILTGPSGAGKTTLMSEYSLDLAMQGVTTLWGSFEIKNERLVRTMLQQFCRLPLHLHLEKFNRWADRFEVLPLYFLTFHGQQPLRTVMETVQHAAYVHDIAHVVIDNVQFMMGLTEGDNSLDRFLRQDTIIGAFRNFATTANCHVTLVVHPRKEKDAESLSMNSVFGGVKATQEADNVLIIQQKTLQNLKLKKFLQIAKNRYSGDLGIMPLDFEKESLSFSQKIQKGEHMVEKFEEN